MLSTTIRLLGTISVSATVQLFTSPATPAALSSALQSLATDSSEERLDVIVISREQELVDMELSVALDYLYNETLSVVLESRVEEGRYVDMWRSAKGESLEYSAAFHAYVQSFALPSIHLISDSQPHNLLQSHFLLSHFPSTFPQSSTLPSHMSLSDCQWFVSRTIKPRGVLTIAFFVDPVTAFNCITAVERLKLNRPGYVYFLSQEASEYRYQDGEMTSLHRNGLLTVAGREAEASTKAEYEKNKLQTRLKPLQNSQFHSSNSPFSLYSIQNRSPFLLSSNPHSPLDLSNAHFPGNATKLIRLSKPSLLASVNYQMTAADGTTSPLSQVVMRGYQLAFEEVNQRLDLIPDYRMRNSSVNYTGIVNNLNVTKGRILSDVGNLGLIHMSPPFSQAVMVTFQALKELNLIVPVTGSSLGSELTDASKYPLYVRTRAGFNYVAVMMCQVFTFLQWKHIAVLYQHDQGESEGSYRIFSQLAGEYGINITNAESERATPTYFTINTSGEVNRSIEAIMASDTRVIVLISSVHFSLLDLMYGLGMREGYEIVVTQGMSGLYFSDKGYIGRRIVNKGGLLFFPSLFVGKVGKSVRKRLIAKDGNQYFPNTCLYYDAAMLYFHATDYLLEKGQDYEDPFTIIAAMRTTRFQGCSGRVKISHDSNDRDPGEVHIYNFQYDRSTDEFEIKLVGSYNPFITQPYSQLSNAIQWPNDQSTFSDSKPKFRDCAYLLANVKYVQIGEILGSALVSSLILLTALTVLAVRKRALQGPWVPVMAVHTTSTYDLISYALGVADFFTFASLGPSVSRMKEIVGMQDSAILLFDRLLKAYGGMYWVRFYISFAFSIVWVSLTVLQSTRIRTFQCVRLISGFGTRVSPWFVSTAFMPIVTAQLQVYICTQGLGSAVTDTFMDADCGTMCWSGQHLKIAIPSGIVLILFIFASLWYRVRLENQHDIQVNPKSVLVKLPTLVLLSGLQVVLKDNHPDLHAYLYFATMAVFLLLISVYEEFNYQRLNMWTRLIYSAVLLFAVVAFLQTKVSLKAGAIALGVLFGLYCLLFISGCLVGRFVSKYRAGVKGAKGKDVRYLFEFAFSLGKRANRALSRHNTINRPVESTEQHFSLYI